MHRAFVGTGVRGKNCVSLNLPFNHDVKRRQSKLALFFSF